MLTGVRFVLPGAGLLLIGGLLAALPATAQQVCLEVPGFDDRCEDWVVETAFGEICCDWVENPAARHIAATTDRVFLALPVNDPGTVRFEERWDWETVALDASDGSQRWSARHEGPAGGWDVPLSVVIDPDESVVYVTGYHDYPTNPNVVDVTGGCTRDFRPASALTIAYDAADGAELWRLGDTGNPTSLNAAFAAAVSPDGSLLFTVGVVADPDPAGPECDFDLGMSAVDTESGAERWATTLAGDPGAWDAALAAAVTPDGSKLIVGGVMSRGPAAQDYVVAALDARDDPGADDAPGEILWEAHHTEPGNVTAPGLGALKSLALSPDGASVFVTGETTLAGGSGIFGNTAYDTLAYETATGKRRWRSVYTTPSRGHNVPLGLAVSPLGDRVFVTGQVVGEVEASWDFGTVAYDASSGQQLWADRYRDPAMNVEKGVDIVVSPDASRVYVAGPSGSSTGLGDAATLTYTAADGSRVWVGRLNQSPAAIDYTADLGMTLSPSGDRVFGVASTQNNVGDDLYGLGQGNDAARGIVWSYDTRE